MCFDPTFMKISIFFPKLFQKVELELPESVRYIFKFFLNYLKKQACYWRILASFRPVARGGLKTAQTPFKNSVSPLEAKVDYVL